VVAARLLTCGKCRATVTVTGPPGATFTCPKCQTVNSIPVEARPVVAARLAAQPVAAKKEANPVVGFIVLLVIGGVVWATCFHSSSSGGGGGVPGAGSVATSGTATERALCAALDGDPRDLPPLIDAELNDAESGISLGLEGTSLEMHLSMTNNAAKVQQDINDMKDTCASQAG